MLSNNVHIATCISQCKTIYTAHPIQCFPQHPSITTKNQKKKKNISTAIISFSDCLFQHHEVFSSLFYLDQQYRGIAITISKRKEGRCTVEKPCDCCAKRKVEQTDSSIIKICQTSSFHKLHKGCTDVVVVDPKVCKQAENLQIS